jgi:hypothetical protein
MLSDARADVQAAQKRIWAANTAARTKGWANRHAEKDGLATRPRRHAGAVSRQHEVEAVTAPARDAVNAAATNVHEIEESLRSQGVLDRALTGDEAPLGRLIEP